MCINVRSVAVFQETESQYQLNNGIYNVDEMEIVHNQCAIGKDSEILEHLLWIMDKPRFKAKRALDIGDVVRIDSLYYRYTLGGWVDITSETNTTCLDCKYRGGNCKLEVDPVYGEYCVDTDSNE